MRRLGLVLVLTAALAVVAGTTSRPAGATYSPTTAPYTQPVNDVPLTNLLNLPDTIPGPGSAPTGSYLTYPAAWDEGANVMTKARMAGRFLPGLEVLGTIGLYATAFTAGWTIGTAANHYFNISGSIGDTSSAPATITAARWNWTVSGSRYCSFSGPCLTSPRWYLQAVSSAWGGIYDERFGDGSCAVTSYCTGLGWASALAGGTFTAFSSTTAANYCGPSSPAPSCGVRTMTKAQADAAISVTPTTAAAYAALPASHKLGTTSYTPPTTTSADLAAARGVMGAPVASVDTSTGTYKDAAGNPLSSGQVVAQLDTNCRLDSSYCAGGANDPTATGGVLSTSAVMPNCVGLLVSACGIALDGAGFTGTRTYHTATVTTADPSKAPDTIIHTTPTPGAVVTKTGTLVLDVNPDAAGMPFLLPAPQYGETATAYRLRLISLGYLGAIAITTLSEEAAIPELGRSAVTTVELATGTTTATSLPVALPAPGSSPAPGDSATPWAPGAPRRTDTPIELRQNPSDLPPFGAAPAGGGCSCPPIDLSPLTASHPSSKFPFGVFAYMTTVVGWFDVTATPPGWNFSLGSARVGEFAFEWNLASFSPYMTVVRGLISLALWVGAIWLIATRMLGLGGAGDLTEAADDGMVND